MSAASGLVTDANIVFVMDYYDEDEIEHRIAKELQDLRAEVRAMHMADEMYGCGFYNEPNWLRQYRRTRVLVGLPEDRS